MTDAKPRQPRLQLLAQPTEKPRPWTGPGRPGRAGCRRHPNHQYGGCDEHTGGTDPANLDGAHGAAGVRLATVVRRDIVADSGVIGGKFKHVDSELGPVRLESAGYPVLFGQRGGHGGTALCRRAQFGDAHIRLGGFSRFRRGGMGAAVSASTGRAALVGSLSVPQTWTGAAPMASTGRAAALADTGLGAAPPATEHEPGMLGALPLADPAGRSIPGALPDPRFLERRATVPPWSTVV